MRPPSRMLTGATRTVLFNLHIAPGEKQRSLNHGVSETWSRCAVSVSKVWWRIWWEILTLLALAPFGYDPFNDGFCQARAALAFGQFRRRSSCLWRLGVAGFSLFQ